MSSDDFSKIKSGAVTSGENKSWWIDSSTPAEFEILNKKINTDVLIIGGGISGLTTAYLLSQQNIKVALVEDGFIGSGESGRTTAHITHALDDRYYEIEKIFGKDGSLMAAESHTAAIDQIEKIVKNEKIKCDFERVDGYLFLDPSDKKANLKKEFDATRRAGLDTQWLEKIPEIKNQKGPCIQFPYQAQFNIMPYLHGLANAVVKNGGKIYTHTHAINVDEQGAICNGFTVKAKHIVVATNSPVNDFVTMHTKQVAFRTYVIAAKIKKGSLSRSLWWDTGDQDSKWFTAPYHYVRTASFNNEFDLLIVGGEDHKTGQADDEDIPEEDRYNALIVWTKKHFPQIEEITHKWSGQVLETLDYMAFIGRNPGNKNIYIVTGDSGNGITHGTLGGMIISDLIRQIKNPWEEFYSPKRIPVKFTGQFLKQQLNVLKQYGDYVTKADINETENLPADSGAILGNGLKRYAAYRDKQNKLHVFSAVCPHLGCVVQWNAEEKSFDCPCHGSRFTKEGVVINGPATANLESIKIKK